MTQFHSRINSGSEAFVKNRTDMLSAIGTLENIVKRAAALSDKSLPRFERRGQLLPRERLNRVLDAGMPFLELMNMAQSQMCMFRKIFQMKSNESLANPG